MKPLFNGIVQVTGEQDSGKTRFALGCGPSPEDICFFDDDIKTKQIVDELAAANMKFGAYFDLVRDGAGMKETAFYEYCMKAIDTTLPEMIKKRGKKFGVLIWDTWARFENCLQPMVAKAPGKYREVYSAKGDIKGAQQWQASFDLEAIIMRKLEDLADMVILVSHLKSESMNGVKNGRLVPDSKRPVAAKSVLRVYLRHNPNGAAPIGLILKRPAKTTVNTFGVQTINILPRKMDPITWERIRYFWENPVGDKAFLEKEPPTEDDISYLTPVLSSQQLLIYQSNVELVKLGFTDNTPVEDNEATPEIVDTARVKELKDKGRSPAEIAHEMGITVPQVIRAIKE